MILTIFKIKHPTTRYQTTLLHHSTPPNTHYQNHIIPYFTKPYLTLPPQNTTEIPNRYTSSHYSSMTSPNRTRQHPYPTRRYLSIHYLSFTYLHYFPITSQNPSGQRNTSPKPQFTIQHDS